MRRGNKSWDTKSLDSNFDEVASFNKQADDYAAETSIHGIKYVREKERTLFERIFWGILFIGGVVLCYYLIKPIYVKWRTNPTLMSIHDTSYPIWKINFPAVTFCPNNRVVKTQFNQALQQPPWSVKAFQKKFNDSNTLRDTMLGVLEKYIYFIEDPNVVKNYTYLEKYVMDKYAAQIPDLLRKVSMKCTDMALVCFWQGSLVDCKDIFKPVRTDNGFCCSFNSAHLDVVNTIEEDSDNGLFFEKDFSNYDSELKYFFHGGDGSGSGSGSGSGDSDLGSSDEKSTSNSGEPVKKLDEQYVQTIYKTNSASTLLGLSILLHPFQKQYEVGVNNFYGFRALVHSPYSFPEVASKGFAIDRGTENFMAISATLTQSTDAVKVMSMDRRHCVLHDESQDVLKANNIELNLFKNYSRNSCLLECRSKLLFKECGCLPYYMPDFSQQWGVSNVCQRSNLECLSQNTASLNALDPKNENPDVDNGLVAGATCNCPNDCEDTTYLTEFSQAKLREDSLIIERLTQSYKPLMELTAYKNELEALEKEFHGKCLKKAKIDDTETTLSAEKGNYRHFVINGITDDCLSYMSLENNTYNITVEIILNKTKERINDIESEVTFTHIYFRELGIVEYVRDELYGIMDVISAFGGLVGLCIGFSLLSAAELIYFFTLRFYNDIEKEKKFNLPE